MKPFEVKSTLDSWAPSLQQPISATPPGNPGGLSDLDLRSDLYVLQARVDTLTDEIRSLRAELEQIRSAPPSGLLRRSSVPPPPLSEDQARDLLAEMNEIMSTLPPPMRPSHTPAVRTSIPRLTLNKK